MSWEGVSIYLGIAILAGLVTALVFFWISARRLKKQKQEILEEFEKEVKDADKKERGEYTRSSSSEQLRTREPEVEADISYTPGAESIGERGSISSGDVDNTERNSETVELHKPAAI